MAINVGNLIIGNTQVEAEKVEEVISETRKLDGIEDGTVIFNGKPKKFNKKMSAYMIDMLTSEE